MSNFDNEVRVTLVTLAEITKDEMVRQVRHRAAVPNPDQLKAFPFLHLLCKVPAKDTVLNDHGSSCHEHDHHPQCGCQMLPAQGPIANHPHPHHLNQLCLETSWKVDSNRMIEALQPYSGNCTKFCLWEPAVAFLETPSTSKTGLTCTPTIRRRNKKIFGQVSPLPRVLPKAEHWLF